MFRIEAAQRMQMQAQPIKKTANISKAAPKESLEYMPSEGHTIEFTSDQFTDKGPATGTIIKSFVTVDGPYITVKFSDAQETFSWDDLNPYVTRKGQHWTVEKTKTTAFTINLKKALIQS